VERTALAELAAILRRLGIRWVLIGALAANRYRATTRLTQDVDLLLADSGPGLEELENAVRQAGWSVRRADPEGLLLRLRHPELGIADLVVAGTDYQQEAMQRAREEAFDERTTARVLTPEDVIIHKLIAGRTQDLADIEAILEAGVDLDEAYLEHWLRFWQIEAAWERLRGAGR
jgi:predicted nucleotidyltransferase